MDEAERAQRDEWTAIMVQDFLREREPNRGDIPLGVDLSDVSKRKLVAAVDEVRRFKDAGGAFGAVRTPEGSPDNLHMIIWAFLAIEGDHRSEEEGYMLLEELSHRPPAKIIPFRG